VSELARQYREGATGYELADRFAIHRTTVSGHLRRAGVAMCGQGLDEQQVDHAPSNSTGKAGRWFGSRTISASITAPPGQRFRHEGCGCRRREDRSILWYPTTDKDLVAAAVGMYLEACREEIRVAMLEKLRKLDGSVAASVSLLTGLSPQQIEDLGGRGEGD
jgi:hypothetical protein